MRAVVIEQDHTLSVLERPAPVPGPGEVLVRVRSAGVNPADLGQRAGSYPAPPGAPADVPGLEFSGAVVAAGLGSTRFAVGDPVMGLVGGGAQAELIAVHERLLVPMPSALSSEQGGGFMEPFVTAHDALVSQGGLRPGERVLVSGASGGVGTAAVQIAAVLGARAVASVRTSSARDAVAALGADRVIDPAEVGGHGPYDVILELVGATALRASLPALALHGRVVVIGLGGDGVLELDLGRILAKRAVLRGSTLRARPLEEKATAVRRIEHELLPLVEAGRLTVPVSAAYPLAEATTAYDAMGVSGRVGRIVLTAD